MAVERLVFLRFSSNVGTISGEINAAASSMKRLDEAYASQEMQAKKSALAIESANQRVITSQERLNEVRASGAGSIAAAEGAVTQAKINASKTQLEQDANVSASARSVAAAEASSATARTAAWQGVFKTTLIGGVALIAGFGEMGKAAATFDNQMRQAAALSDYTREHFGEMSKGVQDLALEVPQSTGELVQGLTLLEKEGINGAQALRALSASAHTATATGSDLASVVNLIGTTMHTWQVPVGAAAHNLDEMVVAAQHARVGFSDLAGAVQMNAPIAKVLGLSFNELTAGIATSTEAGLNATRAGMGLSRSLLQLEKDSKALAPAWSALGVQTGAQAVKTFGLNGTLQKLGELTAGNREELVKIQPQIRSFISLAAQLTDGGRSYNDLLAKLNNSTEVAREAFKAFETQQNSTGNQLKILRNEVTVLAQDMGKSLLPIFHTLIDVGQGIVQMFQSIPGPMKAFIADGGLILGVLAALGGVTGILINSFSKLGQAFALFAALRAKMSGDKDKDTAQDEAADVVIKKQTTDLINQTGALGLNAAAWKERAAAADTPINPASSAPISSPGTARTPVSGGVSTVEKSAVTEGEAVAGTEARIAGSEAAVTAGAVGEEAALGGVAAAAAPAAATTSVLGGAMAALGPIALVAGAGLAAWSISSAQSAAAARRMKEDIDKLTNAIEADNSALADSAGAHNTLSRAQQSADLVSSGAIKNLQALKINTSEALDAVTGHANAQAQLATDIEAASKGVGLSAKEQKSLEAAMRGSKSAGADFTKEMAEGGQISTKQGAQLVNLVNGIAQTGYKWKDAAAAAQDYKNQQMADELAKEQAALNQFNQNLELTTLGFQNVGGQFASQGPALAQTFSKWTDPMKAFTAAQETIQTSTKAATKAAKEQENQQLALDHANRTVITSTQAQAKAQRELNDLKTWKLDEEIAKEELTVQKAVVDRQKATDDLTKAQKNLNDVLAEDPAMQIDRSYRDLEKTQIALTQSQLDLAQAQKHLDWSKGAMPEIQQQAQLDYKSKLLAVKDAQDAVTDAQKKYNDLSSGTARTQEIADAEDAVQQAQFRVADSLFTLTDETRKLKDLRGEGGQQEVIDAEDKVKDSVLGVRDAYDALTKAQRGNLDDAAGTIKDATGKVKVGFADWSKQEQTRTKDASDFQDNLKEINDKGFGVLALQIENMGEDGEQIAKDAIAKINSGSSDELWKLQGTFVERFSTTQSLSQQTFLDAEPLLEQVAKEYGDQAAIGVQNALPGLKDNVGAYGTVLVDNLNSLLRAIGQPEVQWSPPNPENMVGGGQYLGGGKGHPNSYAEGGLEDHQAQIAPGGSWRLWAEPETGGEAYIPLAQSKRGRSSAILEEVARQFGYGLKKYADGAIDTNRIPAPAALASFVQQFGPAGGPADQEHQQVAYNAFISYALEAIARSGASGGLEGSGYKALIDYLTAQKVPFDYPSQNQLTGGVHAPNSYHYRGLAADFTSPNGAPGMDLIFKTFNRVASELAELFYSPEGFSIKDGKRTGLIDAVDHYNHVHAAIMPGVHHAMTAATSGQPGTPAQVEAWLRQAMTLTGVPGNWLPGLEIIAMHESGGNPRDVNNWDSNAKSGNPSEGLMQTTISTFKGNSLPGHGDIFNPVDNSAAAIRYILGRYHDIGNVPGVKSIQGGGSYKPYSEGGIHFASYDQGGELPPGLTVAYNGTGRPETVTTPAQTINPREIAQMVSTAVAGAVKDAISKQRNVTMHVEAAASQTAQEIARDVLWKMKTEGR